MPSAELTLVHRLGGGAFGEVHLALWRGAEVAVKFTRAQERRFVTRRARETRDVQNAENEKHEKHERVTRASTPNTPTPRMRMARRRRSTRARLWRRARAS